MWNHFGRRPAATKYFGALMLMALWPMHDARACATLSDPALQIGIVDEEAIIVWDEARQTQHFIRRANFQARGAIGRKARDFGFLVPTPSLPQLAEADDAAFSRVAGWTLPEKIERERRHYYFWLLSGQRISNTFNAASGALRIGSEPGSVQVLSQQRVGGYDATVLAAKDAGALNRWLQRNGYSSGPQFVQWLRPYIERGWKITAFKIAPGQAAGDGTSRVSSGTVRMSFQTPRPFFPYQEPANQRNAKTKHAPRSLRVFLIGTQRMNGAIGSVQPKNWPAEVRYANAIETQKLGALSTQLALKASQLPAQAWMTVWEDEASPRPGVDDVFFAPATNQEKLVPPPHIRFREVNVYIPVDLALMAVFIIGIILSLRKS